MANSEIIGAGQGTARRAPKKILDPCCGSRMMYFDKEDSRVMYHDIRNEDYQIGPNAAYPNGKILKVRPDVVGDFRKLQFADESFFLVVFDPPHIQQNAWTGNLVKEYGILSPNWKDDLRKGFSECFRVLKQNGTLVFKWNECRIPVREILALTPEKPLFGHRSGRSMQTHWICFIKGEGGTGTSA
jgi:SAM-dependent methyltransferase